MERTLERRQVRSFASRKVRAVLLASGLSLVGCGDNNEAPAQISSAPTETQAPFDIIQNWSLPPHEELSPRFMTAELCEENFWEDEDGKRRPPVQEDPLIIRVDGRCNTPLNEERNGVYATPEQQGPAPIVALNGDALGVECYTTRQPIQDIRGPRSSSEVWLGVVTAKGEPGFFPETNAGYVDESTLRAC